MSREGTFCCHAAPTDCKQEAELYFRNYIVYMLASKHTGYLEFIFGNFNFISEMAMLKVSIKPKTFWCNHCIYCKFRIFARVFEACLRC